MIYRRRGSRPGFGNQTTVAFPSGHTLTFPSMGNGPIRVAFPNGNTRTLPGYGGGPFQLGFSGSGSGPFVTFPPSGDGPLLTFPDSVGAPPFSLPVATESGVAIAADPGDTFVSFPSGDTITIPGTGSGGFQIVFSSGFTLSISGSGVPLVPFETGGFPIGVDTAISFGNPVAGTFGPFANGNTGKSPTPKTMIANPARGSANPAGRSPAGTFPLAPQRSPKPSHPATMDPLPIAGHR